ncbi:MAG TPA: hypothetical protein VFC78_12655 [Tepidisphaeraceae bacterium]|nr:hypothetical protein [Tepidisphaeraceae bacterium]
MPTKKQTGNRCEHLVVSRLLKPGPGPDEQPLFNTALLGSDWPTLDIYVELEGAFPRLKPFFFVQVKGTVRGRDPATHDLRVQLSKKHTKRLLNIPAPTYLVGVDTLTEEMFIRSIHDRALKSISSLRTTYPLDYATMKLIHYEVLEFWQASQHKPAASNVQV